MVKEVKMHTILVSAYKSQDFAQSQGNFERLQDRVTGTFRNSGPDQTRPDQTRPDQKGGGVEGGPVNQINV